MQPEYVAAIRVQRREEANLPAETAPVRPGGHRLYSRIDYVPLQHFVVRIDFRKHDVVAPEIGEVLQHALGGSLSSWPLTT